LAIAAAFSVLSTGLHATNRKEMLRPTRLEILEGAVTLGDNGSIGGEPSKVVRSTSCARAAHSVLLCQNARHEFVCPPTGDDPPRGSGSVPPRLRRDAAAGAHGLRAAPRSHGSARRPAPRDRPGHQPRRHVLVLRPVRLE